MEHFNQLLARKLPDTPGIAFLDRDGLAALEPELALEPGLGTNDWECVAGENDSLHCSDMPQAWEKGWIYLSRFHGEEATAVAWIVDRTTSVCAERTQGLV